MKRTSLMLLLLASLLNLHCGYHLSGLGRNLPAAAQTIAIPDFKNDTSHSQVERFVTTAIKEEFIRRSRLRLSTSVDKADLLLEGRIRTFESVPISNTSHGATSLYEVRITIDVHLIDMNKNEFFYEGTGLVFRETYKTDAADFFSQETGSLNKIAAKFAANIVVSILDNF